MSEQFTREAAELRRSLEAQKQQPAPVKDTTFLPADACEAILDLPRNEWEEARVSTSTVLQIVELKSAGISLDRLRELCDMSDAEFAAAPEVVERMARR